MKHLHTYINKSVIMDLTKRLGDKIKSIGNDISREAHETAKAAQIFLKLMDKKSPTPEEIEFLKGQSVDVVKILTLLGLQAVPGSSIAIVALETALKKYGISVLPKNQTAALKESHGKQVVTFDFDGVMHTGVYPGTIHPYSNPRLWVPNKYCIDKLHDEAKTYEIHIVTARNGDEDGCNYDIEDFITKHDLPVTGIICTNGGKKIKYLQNINSIRHYDDNSDMIEELEGSGIEFVLVDPVACANNVVNKTMQIVQ